MGTLNISSTGLTNEQAHNLACAMLSSSNDMQDVMPAQIEEEKQFLQGLPIEEQAQAVACMYGCAVKIVDEYEDLALMFEQMSVQENPPYMV